MQDREVSEEEFWQRIAAVYADLLAAQTRLEPEFERILMENMHLLYEE